MSSPSGLMTTPFAHGYPEDLETEWIDVMGYAVPLWVSDPESEYRAFEARGRVLWQIASTAGTSWQ